MKAIDRIKDIKKVVTSVYELREQPVPSVSTSIPIDYNTFNKNTLVKMLVLRKIPHNKRQLKAELVALLEKDDLK